MSCNCPECGVRPEPGAVTDWENPICLGCGHKFLGWMTIDDLWNEITGGKYAGLYCMECFITKAGDKYGGWFLVPRQINGHDAGLVAVERATARIETLKE